MKGGKNYNKNNNAKFFLFMCQATFFLFVLGSFVVNTHYLFEFKL